uniref:BAH domain-containing protein n=1 Tax=Chrysotila carterae TaxID=13221 RepID=A0A7S4B9I2_CHRCT
MAESRYDDDGRLVMEEENIILPTEWIGASRKVLGINHYDAVLIGLDGSAQYTARIGDCVFLMPDEDAKPWCEIGLVKELYLAQTGDLAGEKVAKVRWLYRKSQVRDVTAKKMHDRELCYGMHEDENLVESIEGLANVLFYTNRAEAGLRIEEPHTFFCHQTVDIHDGKVGDLKPPATEPSPEPEVAPSPAQPTALVEPAFVQAVQADSTPAAVVEMAAATGVRAEAPAAAGVDGQSTEKRARKNTGGSGPTTMSSIEATLRVALAEIEMLKEKITKLESMVVCLESSSATSASSQSIGSTCSSCHPPSHFGML